MALFTDAGVITLDDLLEFETSLVEVASTHGINVDTKISLSTSAIGDRLLFWLLRSQASDPQWLSRRLLGLSTVVVTATLRRWLCFDILSRFFAEAYNVQLNTRFQGKWTEYQQAASQAADLFLISGIGIVYNPLPKPSIPNVAVVSGTAASQVLYVQTSWVDALGREGSASLTNAVTLPDSSGITVSMAEGVNSPGTAAGWNVYVSDSQDQLYRQNTGPLLVGSTWTLPTSGFVDGVESQDGQQPDFYIIDPKRIQRG